ncbi:hypothetical protein [Lactococcus ileimucosae]|uniref:hypothetical protein n=1 Tax=Lactococcus ileimucosae TaxID=2941329 RepID=UPI0035151408
MKPSEEVLLMLEKAINRDVDFFEFPFELQDWLAFEKGKQLEAENSQLFDYLNEDLPEFLDERDMTNIDGFVNGLKVFYNKAKEFVK